MSDSQYDRSRPHRPAVRIVDLVRFVREADTGYWFPEGGDRRYAVVKDHVQMEGGHHNDWANAWSIYDTEENTLDEIFRYLKDAAKELLKIEGVTK
jgi:hypothetical protein